MSWWEVNELHLFAGAGGGILASRLLGHRTVCAVELDAYCRDVLVQRQDDGDLEPFPIWDDVTTFDGRPWRGLVDCVSGGFPCQDVSIADKCGGAALSGSRSGLWVEMARIVREVEPKFVFVENVAALTFRGLDVVLGDLAKMGFDAEWGCLATGSAAVRGPHRRDRCWILAYARCERGERERRHRQMARTTRTHEGEGLQRERMRDTSRDGGPLGRARAWWSRDPETEPGLGRVADGVARRMDRLRALGNGQVPLCAAVAFRILQARLMQIPTTTP